MRDENPITPAEYDAARAAYAASIICDPPYRRSGRPRVHEDQACACVICGAGYLARIGNNGKLRQTCGRECAIALNVRSRKHPAVT